MLAEGVRFRLWAPNSNFVALKIYDLDLVVPMGKLARGWYEVEVDAARAGMRYRFVLDDGAEVPDPATRFQPEDVDGPSEIIDPLAFGWTDIGWRGHEWEELVLYELHIGTFTQEGTFRAAMDKLDHLVELGVTAIEIMPIADFPGRWNWGYDGAQLFAPDSSYGRPEDLKALVDLAHAKGLSVFLDVVYNHFGPKGNYLAVYAPLTTEHYETPWGSAVNFDDAGSTMVREFFLPMPATGSMNSISTGYGSTRCTKSATPASATCCRNWPSRSAPPPMAGTCISWSKTKRTRRAGLSAATMARPGSITGSGATTSTTGSMSR
ncbi:alpha-amylase family glycosyl hydrolase [Devosia aurantiaca]|nr:alpha-amylase family glycosyl hydrolase [Devosia aurantiaca]